jgi:hypothetical protein
MRHAHTACASKKTQHLDLIKKHGITPHLYQDLEKEIFFHTKFSKETRIKDAKQIRCLLRLPSKPRECVIATPPNAYPN